MWINRIRKRCPVRRKIVQDDQLQPGQTVVAAPSYGLIVAWHTAGGPGRVAAGWQAPDNGVTLRTFDCYDANTHDVTRLAVEAADFLSQFATDTTNPALVVVYDEPGHQILKHCAPSFPGFAFGRCDSLEGLPDRLVSAVFQCAQQLPKMDSLTYVQRESVLRGLKPTIIGSVTIIAPNDLVALDDPPFTLEVAVDASHQPGQNAAAIAAAASDGRWLQQWIGFQQGIERAELEALHVAYEQFADCSGIWLYCDNQSAVRWVHRPSSAPDGLRPIADLLNHAILRGELHVTWVRGHNSHWLNAAADALASQHRQTVERQDDLWARERAAESRKENHAPTRRHCRLAVGDPGVSQLVRALRARTCKPAHEGDSSYA